MSEIKPAMTAEEWRDALGRRYQSLPVDPSDKDEWWGYPHEIAALCLYGQPFGFTREDVSLLRQAIETCDAEWRVGDVDADVAKLRSLAARIEALLPPEA